MTDKERLEEIKQDVKMTRKDLAVSPSNEMTLHMDIMLDYMDYLIEQAERVQELEELSAHHLKMLKYCSDARKKYYGVIKTLYDFDGDVLEHSALADMLCSEALEESE